MCILYIQYAALFIEEHAILNFWNQKQVVLLCLLHKYQNKYLPLNIVLDSRGLGLKKENHCIKTCSFC